MLSTGNVKACGGRGPGSGPIGVKSHLAEFLPGPVARRPIMPNDQVTAANREWWYHWHEPESSIGKVQQWHGNSGAVIDAGHTIADMTGLKTMSQMRSQCKLSPTQNFRRSREGGCQHQFVDGAPVDVVKHEFTISMAPMKEQCGIGAMDIAKGLLDKGYMAPTVYFLSSFQNV